MSILDEKKIDGLFLSDGNPCVMCLMISDHLDWEEEGEHLFLLQEKINDYVEFIQSGQWKEQSDGKTISEFMIHICFLYGYTENCRKLIQMASDVFSPLNIVFKLEDKSEMLRH